MLPSLDAADMKVRSLGWLAGFLQTDQSAAEVEPISKVLPQFCPLFLSLSLSTELRLNWFYDAQL